MAKELLRRPRSLDELEAFVYYPPLPFPPPPSDLRTVFSVFSPPLLTISFSSHFANVIFSVFPLITVFLQHPSRSGHHYSTC